MATLVQRSHRANTTFGSYNQLEYRAAKSTPASRCCNDCGEWFSTADVLRVHRRAQHPNSKGGLSRTSLGEAGTPLPISLHSPNPARRATIPLVADITDEEMSDLVRDLNNRGSRDWERRVRDLVNTKQSELEALTGKSAAAMGDHLIRFKGQPGVQDDDPDARKATRVLTKIVLNSGELPTSLLLERVQRAKDPLTGSFTTASGSGGYGEVFEGRHQGQGVAIKTTRVHTDESRRTTLKEILVLRDLRHAHIIPFIGVSLHVKEFFGKPCLIFPWMENGALDDYLRTTPHTEGQLLRWTGEIAKGLEYLHTRPCQVIHADLKGSNILLDRNYRIYITDFGISLFQRSNDSLTSTRGAGTFLFQAPELQFDDHVGAMASSGQSQILKTSKTPASDVWAFGCVIFEMYSGASPFHYLRSPNHYEVLSALHKGKAPGKDRPEAPTYRKTMPESLWRLVNSCWAASPPLRPSMSEIARQLRADLQHAF